MKYVVDLWSYSSVTCIWLGDKILTTIKPVSLLISTSCRVSPLRPDSWVACQIVPRLYRGYAAEMIGGSGDLFILPITSCRPLIPSIYAILPSYTAVLSARHFRDDRDIGTRWHARRIPGEASTSSSLLKFSGRVRVVAVCGYNVDGALSIWYS